ncbi:hypothetical protein ACFU7Y_31735 [Kitasatospora sp. NPDC057542]|uniref:hypothetical protein n=1 Tax=Streptomycetaceae TaxID=2062 RepID=UPI001CC96146|nr:hypothetical protein [Streptomyces sp. LS1784]
MRVLADCLGGAEDWVVDTLCALYAEHGRDQEGLAYLDTLKARLDGEEERDFFRMRPPLPADCGLPDEAIEQARARPEGGTWYAAWSLSDLLAEAGRTEVAVAVLEQHPTSNSSIPAQRLIDLGRIEVAVQVLQNRPSAEPATDSWVGTCSNEPPTDHPTSALRQAIVTDCQVISTARPRVPQAHRGRVPCGWWDDRRARRRAVRRA